MLSIAPPFCTCNRLWNVLVPCKSSLSLVSLMQRPDYVALSLGSSDKKPRTKSLRRVRFAMIGRPLCSHDLTQLWMQLTGFQRFVLVLLEPLFLVGREQEFNNQKLAFAFQFHLEPIRHHASGVAQ